MALMFEASCFVCMIVRSVSLIVCGKFWSLYQIALALDWTPDDGVWGVVLDEKECGVCRSHVDEGFYCCCLR